MASTAEEIRLNLAAIKYNARLSEILVIIERLASSDVRPANMNVYDNSNVLRICYDTIDLIMNYQKDVGRSFAAINSMTTSTTRRLVLKYDLNDIKSGEADCLIGLSFFEKIEKRLFQESVEIPILKKIARDFDQNMSGYASEWGQLFKNESTEVFKSLVKARSVIAFVNNNIFQFPIHIGALLQQFFNTIVQEFQDFRILITSIPEPLLTMFTGEHQISNLILSVSLDPWELMSLSLQMYLASGKRITATTVSRYSAILQSNKIPPDLKSHFGFITRYAEYVKQKKMLLISPSSLIIIRPPNGDSGNFSSLSEDDVEDVVQDIVSTQTDDAVKTIELITNSKPSASFGLGTGLGGSTSATTLLQKEIQQLKDELTLANEKLANVSKGSDSSVEINSLKGKLSIAETALKETKENLAAVNDQLKLLSTNKLNTESESKKQNEELIVRVRDLESRLIDVLKERDDAINQNTSTAGATLNQLRDELKKTKESLETTLEQKDELTLKNSNLSDANTTLKTQVGALESDNRRLNQEISIIKSNAESQYKQMTEEFTKQVNQLKTLQNIIDDLKLSLSEELKSKDRISEARAKEANEKVKLIDDNKKLDLALKVKDVEIKRLETELINLKTEKLTTSIPPPTTTPQIGTGKNQEKFELEPSLIEAIKTFGRSIMGSPLPAIIPLDISSIDLGKFLSDDDKTRIIGFGKVVVWKSGSAPADERIVYNTIMNFVEATLMIGKFLFTYTSTAENKLILDDEARAILKRIKSRLVTFTKDVAGSAFGGKISSRFNANTLTKAKNLPLLVSCLFDSSSLNSRTKFNEILSKLAIKFADSSTPILKLLTITFEFIYQLWITLGASSKLNAVSLLNWDTLNLVQNSATWAVFKDENESFEVTGYKTTTNVPPLSPSSISSEEFYMISPKTSPTAMIMSVDNNQQQQLRQQNNLNRATVDNLLMELQKPNNLIKIEEAIKQLDNDIKKTGLIHFDRDKLTRIVQILTTLKGKPLSLEFAIHDLNSRINPNPVYV